MVLVLLLLPVAFAANGGGGGGGGGTGGGKDDPLALVASDPEDGATDVMQPVEIRLVFNKNVVHMSVRDANMEKFKMTAPDGTLVPLEIRMADDQIEPEKREEVYLIPQEQLLPDTVYTITIAGGLESKSNAVLGQDINLSFRTATAEVSASTSDTVSQDELPRTSSALSPSAVGIAVFVLLIGAAIGITVAKRLRHQKKTQ